jgi:uncharacterized membrane protein YeaQ/YmgE (transglycosylase-associated protein family)
MSILAWLVVGLVAGWLAGQITRGYGFGVVGDIIVGVLGAMVGGFLAAFFFGGDYVTGINLGTILVSVIGAVVLIGVVRLLGGRATI